MLLMVFAIIMSIINLKLYYVCTSLHVKGMRKKQRYRESLLDVQ